MNTHMVREFFHDPWSYVGSMGMAMIVAIHWITENYNPLIAALAGTGGLILVVVGIAEKVIKYKAAKQEYRRNKLEADELERNIGN